MAGKKALTPVKFRSATVKHLKKQPKQKMSAKSMAVMAKGRTKHYGQGANLIKQVSKTLQQLAASHPNPKARKQAKLAVSKLNDAQCAFGTASLCQGTDWNAND